MLLHNPRCSKSRAAHALLERARRRVRGAALSGGSAQPRGARSLRERLGRPAAEWVRSGEAAFATAGLDASSSEAQILDAMAAHPILLERPILVRGTRAVVGRPPERVLELL